MPTPDTAKDALRRAETLEGRARHTSAYLVAYFRVWAAGSLLLGIALFFMPRLGMEYYVGCLALWVVFIAALLVFYFRGRGTRPRRGPALTLGIVGGSVPWTIAVIPQPWSAAQTWWIAGLPFLVAGLVCAVCLIVAAELARRHAA